MKQFLENTEFEARRKRMFEAIKEDSLVILFAGVPKICSADEDYPFEANHNFYYLSGIDQDDSALLLYKGEGETKAFLFVSPYDERKEKWTGKRLTYDEARELSGITNVLPRDSFETMLEKILDPNILQLGPVSYLYSDFQSELKIAPGVEVFDFRKQLLQKYPYLQEVDADCLITGLRLVKSPSEISLLKTAISITDTGIRSVMRRFKDGVKEYELANEFLHVINDASGNQGLSFPTIMAGGKRATVLHYTTLQEPIYKDEMVLMDLGARYGYYNADISRTFPICGKFSPLQKKIYSIVLEANKMIAALARPGLTLRQLNQAVIDYYAKVLVEEGIIDKPEDVINVYFHSVSHFIGLDTHDPLSCADNTPYRDVPLRPGCVISDEPGLYIPELGIGVRIEDDLYITETGCINLSSGILKEVEEIEAFFDK